MARIEPFRFVQRATPYTRKRLRLINGRRHPDPYMQARPRFRLGDWLDRQVPKVEGGLILLALVVAVWALSGCTKAADPSTDAKTWGYARVQDRIHVDIAHNTITVVNVVGGQCAVTRHGSYTAMACWSAQP